MLTETLKALSDPVRRQILEMLKKGSRNAGQITSCFQISDAAISRHLSVLKNADLIRSWREGKFIYYELNTSVLDEVLLWTPNLKGDENELSEQSVLPAVKTSSRH